MQIWLQLWFELWPLTVTTLYWATLAFLTEYITESDYGFPCRFMFALEQGNVTLYCKHWWVSGGGMSELFILSSVQKLLFCHSTCASHLIAFYPLFICLFCSPCRSSAGRCVFIRALSVLNNGNLLILYVNKVKLQMWTCFFLHFLQYQNILHTKTCALFNSFWLI